MEKDRTISPLRWQNIRNIVVTHFRRRYPDYVSFLVVLILSFVGIFYFFNLSKVDLNTPLIGYSGSDDMSVLVDAKLIAQTGGTMVNNSIGAPFGSNGYDFLANSMHNFDTLVLKLCVQIFKEPAISVNMFYLSLFIMIGAISFFVMRQLKIRPLYAILGSLTFEFMPYIFIRGVAHIVLSAYMFVPLSILLCIWAFTEKGFLIPNRNFFKNKKNIIAIISTVLIANNGIAYYAFFTCLFLFIVMLSKVIKTKKLSSVVSPIILIVLISFFTAINLIPSRIYNSQNGVNTAAVTRSLADAEQYGLKIAQLFLPVNGHGIPKLKKLIYKYNTEMPLVNENRSAYLGIVGIIGFIILLLFLVRKSKNFESDNINRLKILSEMNVFGVLFATIGGFSSLFSIVTSEMIRSHNRISIFIAYICILSVMLFLEEITKKNNRKIIYIIAVIICTLGILEQVPANITRNHSAISTEYKSDAAFVAKIESEVPSGSMIYQMPYHKTPEGGSVNAMGDYQLYVGYIHSKDLKWSFGAVKGRAGDKWFETVSSYPLDKQIKTISLAGYNGIYIDTRAYTKQNLATLEKSIEAIIGEPPIQSSDKNLIFFNMTGYNKNLKSHYTESEYNELKKDVFNINQ